MAERAIIGLADWLKTPAGRYVLQWEQAQLDTAVVDVFGFHALQVGLPELDALHANRMPHRWLASAVAATASVASAEVGGAAAAGGAASSPGEPLAPPGADVALPPRTAVALLCDFDALPFDSASLDLVVLPHSLELARDPHLALREVERVLMPEGRVVIVGFNPASLWGMRQRLGRWWARIAPNPRRPFLPKGGEFMRFRRLRDWLRLLSFEVETGHFGCYRPPVRSRKWLARFGWIEPVGQRWWPVFGAVYLVVAVKRVRGMRLVGLAPEKHAAPHAAAAPVVAAHHNVDSDEASR